jgi:peroxiredoxin
MSQFLIVGLVLGWSAILAGWWLGWQLLRQNGRILLRLDELENRLNELEFGSAEEPKGLPPGSEAPAFELPNLAGERKSLAQFRGQPVWLIFFNPNCGFCREMVPKLAAIQSQRSEGRGHRLGGEQHPLLLVVSSGDAEKNRQLFAEHRFTSPVMLQHDGEAAKAYQTHGTPSGYLIDPEGKIASELAVGAEALLKLATEPRSSRGHEAHTSSSQPSTLNAQPESENLLTSGAADANGRVNRFGNRSLARSKIERDGLKAGTPAPDFRLPRLDGRGELALRELRGRRVLLVFSSPHCGPCNTLAPELEKFHRAHPELEVVMISKGEPKENRAKVKEHGLTFPVVLQQQWEISRRYAMFATPIAYLIDEAGTTVHDVAVGTDAILKLLRNGNDHHDSINGRGDSDADPGIGLSASVARALWAL